MPGAEGGLCFPFVPRFHRARGSFSRWWISVDGGLVIPDVAPSAPVTLLIKAGMRGRGRGKSTGVGVRRLGSAFSLPVTQGPSPGVSPSQATLPYPIDLANFLPQGSGDEEGMLESESVLWGKKASLLKGFLSHPLGSLRCGFKSRVFHCVAECDVSKAT